MSEAERPCVAASALPAPSSASRGDCRVTAASGARVPAPLRPVLGPAPAIHGPPSPASPLSSPPSPSVESNAASPLCRMRWHSVDSASLSRRLIRASYDTGPMWYVPPRSLASCLVWQSDLSRVKADPFSSLSPEGECDFTDYRRVPYAIATRAVPLHKRLHRRA